MTWQIKKLGEVLKLEYGKPLPKSDRGAGGKYPVYGANGIKSWSNKFYYDKFTIIVGRKGSAGEINLTKEKFWPLDVTYFVTFDDKKYNLKFLYNLLDTLELTKLARGVKPGINRNDVYDINVKIPELKEQHRIVKILDEVFEKVAKAKENAEKNLQNAKELFASYLQIVFSNPKKDWQKNKLSEICEKITDGTHQTPKYFDEGFIFLSSRNVTSGKINWEKIKYIDKKQHLEMHKRVSPRKGDILLAKNGTTGVAAMVDKDVIFDIYVSLALLRAKEMILPSFLLYFVNSPVAKKQFNKRLKGSGVPNLHLEEIREVVVSFPKSLTEQKSIVNKLDALSAETKKLEAIYKQKLADFEELKKSVLKKAFAGEL